MTCDVPFFLERQELSNCAIHAVNNLLQSAQPFEQPTKALFDAKCDSLAEQASQQGFESARFLFIGPSHRIPFLGYYGARVVVCNQLILVVLSSL